MFYCRQREHEPKKPNLRSSSDQSKPGDYITKLLTKMALTMVLTGHGGVVSMKTIKREKKKDKKKGDRGDMDHRRKYEHGPGGCLRSALSKGFFKPWTYFNAHQKQENKKTDVNS